MIITIALIVGSIAALIYVLAALLLALYGLHSLWLLQRFYRHHSVGIPLPLTRDEPAVLVQLPVFNERDVVERMLAAVGRLDWPANRLRIQLLDDSTDDSLAIGAQAIARLHQAGLEAIQVQRADRSGFKAGALAHGLELDAEHRDGPAEFIAIFDADFVPETDFLRRALPSLMQDVRCAFVQGRWEHLNPDQSLLTRAQAMGIDGHFAIEQGARAWSGLALNFNGTCGVWRREAILASGGWQHDTLTEDLDLSYRVHLAGWHATYRSDLAVPGELPATIEAWRSQQFRWAKGSLQTARKLLPSIWRSSWSMTSKIAATAHLSHYLIHPLILISLILAPAAIPTLATISPGLLWLGLLMLACGMLPPLALYVASQRILGRGWRRLAALPALTSLGTGIAISNSQAAWEACCGAWSEFVRTPKDGSGGTTTGAVKNGSYRAAKASGMLELAAAAWGLFGLTIAWHGPSLWLIPMLCLYVIGFAHHGARLFLRQLTDAIEATREPVPRPWWPLLPLGAASLTIMVLLANHPSSWRESPTLFGIAALALGMCCLAGLHIAKTRPLPMSALLWILAVGAALNLIATGLDHSDDVHRYAVEGHQLLAGQNPYQIPPLATEARALVPDAISAGVNHPHMTAIYPPLTLAIEAIAQALLPGLTVFTAMTCVASLLAIGLSLGLLVGHGLAPGLIIIVAWNPVLAIFASGEAHHDIFMAILILAALLLAQAKQLPAALVALAAAVLIKPFAAILAPAVLALGQGKRWWLLPLIIVTAYLPFASAGAGLFASLSTFGGTMHFHGALDTWLRLILEPLLAPAVLEPAIRLLLLTMLGVGGLWLWHRRGAAPLPTVAIRAFALLLLCLPTLHPWYFLGLVVLLPFARTWALAVWTCCAGIYWLHGIRMQDSGGWSETPWVTALAHLPALLLMAYEAFGPARESPEPGAFPLPFRLSSRA